MHIMITEHMKGMIIMGLTRFASISDEKTKKNPSYNKVIALAGNPNVGKSTVFNALTGLKQHTGNWPGKTVTYAEGYCQSKKNSYTIVDIPGTYSLITHSAEEEIARDFICSKNPDCVIVVCDATCLERNLNLVLQISQICPKVVVCLNLMDEAKRKGIYIDTKKLEELLGLPVVPIIAKQKKGLDKLLAQVDCMYTCSNDVSEPLCVEEIVKKAEEITNQVVTHKQNSYSKFDKKADKILTSKLWGYPIMILMLAFVLWLTISGANYPSQLLSNAFSAFESILADIFNLFNAPSWLYGALVLGVYRVVSWVVSVMLPPMAIFFPLFTILEDLGYLPRIAYNLDKPFKKCCACGKQALTMCMGFGCNAVGVVGCRIIDSPRERLLAILTNNFVPCNGRFPILISVLTMFFVSSQNGSSILSALLLTAIILFGILATFISTKLLSKTLLKGVPSSFTLELPSYRRPKISDVVVRSIFDRTLFVLKRAVAVAAPAGLIIWILANIKIGNISILKHCALFLDPFGKFIGLDGVILMAFILGLPANEIVIPIAVMIYMSQGTLTETSNLIEMKELLVANGWTVVTALNVMIFTIMHWPCSTTLQTIKKETNSIKWTVFSAVFPTVIGILLCSLITFISKV